MYNRVYHAPAPCATAGSEVADTNLLLEALPDLWSRLRGGSGTGWVHPAGEVLACGALATPLTPAAQVSLMLVTNTGGPLHISTASFNKYLRGVPLGHLAVGLRFLPGSLQTPEGAGACAFTKETAHEVYNILVDLLQLMGAPHPLLLCCNHDHPQCPHTRPLTLSCCPFP